VADKETNGRPAIKTTKSPFIADNGQILHGNEPSQLNTQDLSVLEKAIRGRVSGLVNSMHAPSEWRGSRILRQPDLNTRLYPELDERAVQLPNADKALSFRESFLVSLIDPDPRHHREIIDELVGAHIPMQTLAIHLFCPVATRLGTYWCDDETDFMQVAIASTRLNTIINHVTYAGGKLINPRPTAKRVLLARSRGTQHTLGVTLVRMCFRDMGWIVDGGADMEIGDTLYMRLSEKPYDLLGLSVGQVEEKNDCRETILRCRSEPAMSHMVIALGGAAVVSRPGEFDDTGADIIAHSALEVMNLTDQLSG